LAAGAALALLPAGVGIIQIERARQAAAFGRLPQAEALLRSARRVVPIIGENGDFTLQLGLIQARLGISTPEAELYRAKVLQADGRLERAEASFAALVQRKEVAGAVRREALRAALRGGIRQLNSGETVSASEGLTLLLRSDPCNLKANYVLQLAELRTGRYDRLNDLVARMRAVYRFLHVETKLAVLANAQENVAYAAYQQGDAAGAAEARSRAADPVWLEQ
jgi:tetratricopeptide (TPR) repeat protein